MKQDEYKEMLNTIDSLYTSKSKEEVNLEGIYGETFFINKELRLKVSSRKIVIYGYVFLIKIEIHMTLGLREDLMTLHGGLF